MNHRLKAPILDQADTAMWGPPLETLTRRLSTCGDGRPSLLPEAGAPEAGVADLPGGARLADA